MHFRCVRFFFLVLRIHKVRPPREDSKTSQSVFKFHFCPANCLIDRLKQSQKTKSGSLSWAVVFGTVEPWSPEILVMDPGSRTPEAEAFFYLEP